MTVGSGGCSISKGEVTVDTSNLPYTPVYIDVNIGVSSATQSSTSIISNTTLTKTTYYLNNDKIYSSVNAVPDGSNTAYNDYFIDTPSILIDSDLIPGTRYHVDVIINNNMIGTTKTEYVDSNGDLYLNLTGSFKGIWYYNPTYVIQIGNIHPHRPY